MRTDYRVFQARNGAWVVAERRGSRERLVGRHADKDAAIRDRDRRAKERLEAIAANGPRRRSA